MERKPRLKEILSSSVFIIIIGALLTLNIVIPAPAVLLSERRVPAKLPELSADSILSGNFMSKFDSYASDSFVFRDTFREIQAFMILDVFMLNDKSGLYRSENVGTGELTPVNATSYRQSAERIKRAADSLAGLGINVYYSIIPDKSVYAGGYLPGFETVAAESAVSATLDGYEYIRLTDALSAGSFYKTDLHWDQTRIEGAVDALFTALGAEPAHGDRPIVEAGLFRGVYAGQLALPAAPDRMSYVDIQGLRVNYLNEKTLQFEPGPLYDTERFYGVDPYDLFLRGPQPLIIIENEAAPERELYLFRDSFGSSLAPLLASAYSRVVLIDLRYINFIMLDQFIDLRPGSDALFIYSSQILNNPSVIQA